MHFLFIKFRQDYGVRSLESVLDIVKVMDFALQNGKVLYFVVCIMLFATVV